MSQFETQDLDAFSDYDFLSDVSQSQSQSQTQSQSQFSQYEFDGDHDDEYDNSTEYLEEERDDDDVEHAHLEELEFVENEEDQKLPRDSLVDEQLEYDLRELPDQHCEYCGIHEPDAVVQCRVCRKWFCNWRGESSTAHIVHHLVRSKHKQVVLHPQAQLRGTPVECYNCRCRNVFLLGFVPARNESVVMMLCREPCLTHPSLVAMEWNPSQWEPLIQDRHIIDWLVRRPDGEQLERAIRSTSTQMVKLEEAWFNGREDATLYDLDEPELNTDPEPVLNRYEDSAHYRSIMSPLVQMEADYDRKIKESQTRDGVTVEWRFSEEDDTLADHIYATYEGGSHAAHAANNVNNSKNTVYAVFRFASTNVSGQELHVVPGDQLRLCHDGLLWQGQGQVMKVTEKEDIILEVSDSRHLTLANEDEDYERKDMRDEKKKPVPTDCQTGFRVEYVWKSTTFDRQLAALKAFTTDARGHPRMANVIRCALLGHGHDDALLPPDVASPLPRVKKDTLVVASGVQQPPKLPSLNASQLRAVSAAVGRSLCLIQGPPGTGKTVTSATIVYNMVQQAMAERKAMKKIKAEHRPRVLVVAPSNIAVDQLTAKLHRAALKVVRVCSRTREKVQSDVDFLTLHRLMYQFAEKQRGPLFDLLRRKEMYDRDESKRWSKKDQNKLRKLQNALEKELLLNADVICTTCVGAGDPRLKDFMFTRVLVDESTQATEPESLIPLVKGVRQLCMVGDHCQLGPVIMHAPVANAGMQRSLFERLIVLGVKPVRLQVQYRMHPALSQFPSNTFYEGSLSNGVSAEDRPPPPSLREFWPSLTSPMMFWVALGQEEFSSSGTSFLNRVEAAQVEQAVTYLMSKGGARPDQIGVVTPYEGQRHFIRAHMQRAGQLPHRELYDEVEVASVDAFQGREKDYIILSCVRSNEHAGIGFLKDPRRMNVALTRAKYGLIVVGNARVLSRHQVWNNLLFHFKRRNVLVEGRIQELRQSNVRFSNPRRFHNDRLQRDEDDDTYGGPMLSLQKQDDGDDTRSKNDDDLLTGYGLTSGATFGGEMSHTGGGSAFWHASSSQFHSQLDDAALTQSQSQMSQFSSQTLGY